VPLLQNQPLEPTQRLDALVQGNLAPVQVRRVRPRNHRLNRLWRRDGDLTHHTAIGGAFDHNPLHTL
jgi:hypothetical protein